jgi:hypothetical protein
MKPKTSKMIKRNSKTIKTMPTTVEETEKTAKAIEAWILRVKRETKLREQTKKATRRRMTQARKTETITNSKTRIPQEYHQAKQMEVETKMGVPK